MSGPARVRRLVGAVLLVAGAVVVLAKARVLSTFLLDLIVGTLGPPGAPPPPPQAFSWGWMEWGNSGADFSLLCLGFVLTALGHLLLVPPLLDRSKCAPAAPKLVVTALGGSILAMVLAAFAMALVFFRVRGGFAMLSTTGVADPVSFGEDMPVRINAVFTWCFTAAQVLILVAVYSVPRERVQIPHPATGILAIGSGVCLLFFGLAVSAFRAGPIRAMFDVLHSPGPADPVDVARNVSRAIHGLLLVSPLLAGSAVFLLVALLVPSRRAGE